MAGKASSMITEIFCPASRRNVSPRGGQWERSRQRRQSSVVDIDDGLRRGGRISNVGESVGWDNILVRQDFF